MHFSVAVPYYSFAILHCPSLQSPLFNPCRGSAILPPLQSRAALLCRSWCKTPSLWEPLDQKCAQCAPRLATQAVLPSSLPRATTRYEKHSTETRYGCECMALATPQVGGDVLSNESIVMQVSYRGWLCVLLYCPAAGARGMMR